jgi:hypothetical protein
MTVPSNETIKLKQNLHVENKECGVLDWTIGWPHTIINKLTKKQTNDPKTNRISFQNRTFTADE